MAEQEEKYSVEYIERYGFNAGELYWMEQAFETFCERAKKEVKQAEEENRALPFTALFFPLLFKDVMEKAKQWSTPCKVPMLDD